MTLFGLVSARGRQPNDPGTSRPRSPKFVGRCNGWMLQAHADMNLYLLSTFIGVLFAASAFTAVRGDVQILTDTGGMIDLISIQGAVTERDAKTISDIENRLAQSRFRVSLDSRDGDVAAAMEIGRLIRKYDGMTIIYHDMKCYSSCALIFIAGVIRKSNGELGLHRPYLAIAPQGQETVEQQVIRMFSSIKSYVADMGVADNFYQLMVNTEPSKMLIYTGSEYEKLVPELDPTYEETQVRIEARRYGVTTSEMRARKAETERCPHELQKDDSISFDCGDAIKWGLNLDVYLRRVKETKKCWFSDNQYWSNEERDTYNKTPQKTRNDLPFVLAREACIRNIMLGRQP